ncbi:chemotaxis protein CheW [Roseiarcaceae bacterium H3SJ34-1]|uniref:chemotaxis protein CheW n=1 Tax=Terripilifer ovatus TaxID=3032367 RepID=UPI003AB9A519|nr:chemotaxis protein CheW [Roseiarcaceae bacterium H3SJ34-1]
MNRPELFRRSSMHDASRGHTAVLSDLVFTITVAGETFGLPIDCVRTVFRVGAVTPVPRAPPHIVGLINLRGKAVNAICLRRRLDLPGSQSEKNPFAVCIECAGEDFALIVDAVHDVVQFSEMQRIPVPSHVSDARARVTALLYNDAGGIVPLLDIERLVMEPPVASAA